MATIFSVASYLNGDLVFIVTLFLLIGACAKSSQLGLHTWLASAMEGPTPVSALIHAATMVPYLTGFYLKDYLLVISIQFTRCFTSNKCQKLHPY